MRFLFGCGLLLSLLLPVLPGSGLAWAQHDDAGSKTHVQNEAGLRPEVLYLLLLGEIAFARDDWDIAAKAYIQATRETQDGRIAQRASEIAHLSNNIPAALEAARLWIGIDPDSSEAKRILASSLAGGEGQRDQILFDLARILAGNPDHLEANLLGLNRALNGIQDKQMVRAIIDRLTLIYADQPAAYFARAEAAEAAGDRIGAMISIDEALHLQPDWEFGVIFKARLLASHQAMEESLALLRATLARQPQQTNTLAVYAQMLMVNGQDLEAEQAILQLLQLTPDNYNAYLVLASLYTAQERFDEAREMLKAALKLQPGSESAAYFALAELAERQGRSAAAIEAYRKVTSGEGFFEAQLRLARLLAREGKLPQARMLLHDIATDDESEVRRILITEVSILRSGKQYAAALTLLDEALGDAPEDTDLLYESAILADQLQRYDLMEKQLRRFIQLDPENPHGYNALGYSLADRSERLEEAATLIETAHKMVPEDPYVLDSLGWLRYRQGRLEEALMLLEQAYAIRQDPEIAAHLGEILWRKKQHYEARAVWTDSLKAHPENNLLQKTVKRFLP